MAAMKIPSPSARVAAPYLDALAGKDPLKSMAKTARRLERLLQRFKATKSKWDQRPSPQKWSIKQVLNHLADHEVIQGARWRMVAAMEKPPIASYDQNAFTAAQDLKRASAKDLVRAFRQAREANLAFLARLGPKVWEKSGMHAERGEETMADMTWRAAGHDRIHEAQLARTLEELATAKARPKRRKQAKAPKSKS